LFVRWAVLEIETRDAYPDWVQAYSAGLLEGSLTWQLIYWHWQNTVQNVCEDRMEFCKHVHSLVSVNSEKIKDLAEKNGHSDPFWHQVCCRNLLSIAFPVYVSELPGSTCLVTALIINTHLEGMIP
jgi:hypothetical protein